PYERDRVTVDAGVAEDAKPFLGHNFQTTLRELEGRMRKAAADLEFEEAARLRDEIKRLKMLDLEFANEALTPEGETADRGAVKLARAEARAEAAERYRRGGRPRGRRGV
ncbi:MAG TPA: UvrB/UvrC motif-containing protein, partial [Thermoanaerobaculia bacterium]